MVPSHGKHIPSMTVIPLVLILTTQYTSHFLHSDVKDGKVHRNVKEGSAKPLGARLPSGYARFFSVSLMCTVTVKIATFWALMMVGFGRIIWPECFFSFIKLFGS